MSEAADFEPAQIASVDQAACHLSMPDQLPCLTDPRCREEFGSMRLGSKGYHWSPLPALQ